MGGAASINHRHATKYLSDLEVECNKPMDGSDVPDFENCKKELIELRAKLRNLYNETIHIQSNEERVMRESINKLMKSAVEVEGVITRFLEEVVQGCNGQLVGLKFRFKTRDSLERKVLGDIETKKRQMSRGGVTAPLDIATVVGSIGDALRYTMLIPDTRYCDTVLQVRQRLHDMGFPGVKFKNYWEKGDMYQGINDMYRCTANGFVFELQFHTADSWDLKAESHVIYEKFRVCKDPIEMQKLFDQGTDLANRLNVPIGVEQLPNLVRNPEPDLLSAYAQLISEQARSAKSFLEQWFKSTCPECDVYMSIDDERTIESELHAMVDALNKAVDKIVLNDYFYAIMIRIVIPNPDEYVSTILHLIAQMRASAAQCDAQGGDSKQQQLSCCQVINQWLQPEGSKCVRVLSALGSRQSAAPVDNLLFEVVLHTPQSAELDLHAQRLMRLQATKGFHEHEQSGSIRGSIGGIGDPEVQNDAKLLAQKVQLLWTACEMPPKIEAIVSSATSVAVSALATLLSTSQLPVEQPAE